MIKNNRAMRAFKISPLLILLLIFVNYASAQPLLSGGNETKLNASSLFAAHKPAIYQVRVINLATGQKTSIGSGFIVGDGTLLASNYHVISDIIRKENHVLRYLAFDDNEGDLELVAVDIINDLVLLKASHNLGKAFTLGKIPPQGASIYALGNPHDLGFIIVDGINNGLLQKSSRDRILFSGSLNSGMSGGATLDEHGNVIGVNVAYLREGNDISFVIPANHLANLLDKYNAHGKQDILTSISSQLFDDNEKYYRDYLKKQWQKTTIGKFRVPLAMRNDVKCWDSSPDNDVDDLIALESVTCFNDRQTYINEDVSIGQFGYSYVYLYAREPILRSRFYRLYSNFYRFHFYKRPRKDYDDFECKSEKILLGGKLFKTTFCTQASKQFKRDGQTIDDIRLIAAQIGEDQHGFTLTIAINGVQSALGKEIIKHILEQIAWQQ